MSRRARRDTSAIDRSVCRTATRAHRIRPTDERGNVRYEHPVLIRSYAVAELVADAAACMGYYTMTTTSYNASDERLKTDIEPV